MKRIIKLDASALVQSACKLRMRRILFDGYSEKLPTNDLLYGSAFHKFVATMHETMGDIALATFAAQEIINRPCTIRDGKDHLNEHHLLKTCFDYWDYYKKKDNSKVVLVDGKPLVEIDFAVKLYEDDNNIVMGLGTSDRISKVDNGCYVIDDYKTHSLSSMTKNGKNYTDYHIAEFLKSFELSLQLRFYYYCLKKASETLYKDTKLAEIFGSQIATRIQGVFISKTADTVFRASDGFFFKQADMESFEIALHNKCAEICAIANDYNVMDGILSGACSDGKFKCRYWKVCAAPDDIARKFLLEQQYVKREYNPLEFSK